MLPTARSLPPAVRLACVASVLAWAVVARAQADLDLPLEDLPPSKTSEDTTGPEIKRVLPKEVLRGPVMLRARITDPSDVFSTTVYWRHVGEDEWQPAVLTGDRALFSAQVTVQRDFEFYIEAFDALGNASYDGSPEEPIAVRVADAPVSVAPKKKAAPKAPPVVKKVPPKPPPPPKPAVPRPPPKVEPPEPPSPPLGLARVLRVGTARPITAGRGEVLVDGTVFGGTGFLLPNAQLLGGIAGVRIAYAPWDFVEASFGSSSRVANLQPQDGSSRTQFSLGDVALGLRFVSPELGPVRLALEGTLDVPSGVRGEYRFAASTGLGLAITYTNPWFLAHLQAAYGWDETDTLLDGRWSPFSTFALGLSRFDSLRVGVAAETRLGPLSPFVEYVVDVPIERRHFLSCEGDCRPAPPVVPGTRWSLPQRIGAGVRLELFARAALVAGGEWSLTPAGMADPDGSNRTVVAVDGLSAPPPWAARLQLVWQFGTALDPIVLPPAVPVPVAPVSVPTSPDVKLTTSPPPPPQIETPATDALLDATGAASDPPVLPVPSEKTP